MKKKLIFLIAVLIFVLIGMAVIYSIYIKNIPEKINSENIIGEWIGTREEIDGIIGESLWSSVLFDKNGTYILNSRGNLEQGKYIFLNNKLVLYKNDSDLDVLKGAPINNQIAGEIKGKSMSLFFPEYPKTIYFIKVLKKL